ncbi:MAG: tRNA (5-methylaminomethyl-2-thiouridine)(34)-methyltransferase MnmD [Caulobacterales bacterium]|nr:tRNA (5-methylaminomethyl-2-thiouridine)(34)-methyltransferase MnmD [Caulobacterales bacterium]
MTPDAPSSTDPVLQWSDDGLPRSGRFGDVYFSSDDGLAESRAVFLAGCGLPDAWAGRRRFTVSELGFGTGLNIAALLDLWSKTRPPGGRLHIFSIEAFPVSREDAALALGRWPELSPIVALMLARWPRRARGFHRLDLPELGATLDLAVMEVETALSQWRGTADAWFLDGFAPATNPGMWNQTVLDLVAARSAPGARAATFTVAGAVRRGLEEAGFTPEKRPGHGRKRERLEARLPSEPVAEPALPTVAILGAGIAGAALARAFRAEGIAPTVIDARGPGGGASGNPAGLVSPRLDAGMGPAARLYAQAFARAVDLYAAQPQAVIARGALQLETGPRDEGRFDAIVAGDLFETGALTRLTAADAAARLGEPAPAGLEISEAVLLEPAALLAAWTGPVTLATVAAIAPRDGRPALLDQSGALICLADVVCIAAGHAAAAFAPDLTLQPVRGQASWTVGPAPAIAVSGSGYAIPTRDGVLFGATFDRDNADETPLDADDARNLALLAQTLPGLAAKIAGRPLSSRAGVRAATRDRLPLAGAAPGREGVFILAGLGSRGLCTAPLLAEHLVALALDAPSPLPVEVAAQVDPARFAERARRRGSS